MARANFDKIHFHKHHILPKHMGGTNDPSNIIKVNVPLHAFLHKLLWEEHGKLEDKVAYLTLMGLIDKVEAHRLLVSRPKTEEQKRKISESKKGQAPFLGKKHTESSKRKMSASAKGRTAWNKGLTKENNATVKLASEKITGIKKNPVTIETKRKLSLAAKEQWKRQKADQ